MSHCVRLTTLALLVFAMPAVAEEADQPLSKQLKEMTEGAKQRMPAPMLKTFEDAIVKVRETGIEKSAKQVGDEAPDGTLVSWDEKETTLSDLWKEQPVVLTWYRGGWCPYCNLQLRAMEKQLDELEGAGARLVALTPELPKNAKETAEKNKLSFLVLHDKENKLAHKYGIVFKLPESIVPIYRDRLQLGKVNGYDKLELPMAATYVIDREGVIRYAFLKADYKKRAEPAKVIEAVKKLNEE